MRKLVRVAVYAILGLLVLFVALFAFSVAVLVKAPPKREYHLATRDEALLKQQIYLAQGYCFEREPALIAHSNRRRPVIPIHSGH